MRSADAVSWMPKQAVKAVLAAPWFRASGSEPPRPDVLPDYFGTFCDSTHNSLRRHPGASLRLGHTTQD